MNYIECDNNSKNIAKPLLFQTKEAVSDSKGFSRIKIDKI